MKPTQKKSFKPLTNQYGKVVLEIMKAKKPFHQAINAKVKILQGRY